MEDLLDGAAGEGGLLKEQVSEGAKGSGVVVERPTLWFALFMMAAVILAAAVFGGGQGEGHVWAGSAEPVPGPVIQEGEALTSTLYLPIVMRAFDPSCPGCPPLFGIFFMVLEGGSSGYVSSAQ